MPDKKVFLVVLLCLGSGCTSVGGEKATSAQQKTLLPEFVQTGKVFDSKRLREGGNLLIVPFSAGIDVEAGEESDKLSLMVVRGIVSGLRKGHSSVKVLVADDADTSNLTLRGYLVTMETPSSFKKWTLGKKKKRLGVKGKIIENATGKVLLQFLHYREVVKDSQSFEKIALVIGEDIGRFILLKTKDEE